MRMRSFVSSSFFLGDVIRVKESPVLIAARTAVVKLAAIRRQPVELHCRDVPFFQSPAPRGN